MRYLKRDSGSKPEAEAGQGRGTLCIRLVRLIRLFVVSLAFAGLLVFLLLAWGYVHMVLYAPCTGTFANLDDAGYPSELVTFESQGGYRLRGWYISGDTHPEYAVIVVPGHSSNTSGALANALTVAEAGYSVLIYEHRVCADPDRMASTGYYESLDAEGAIRYVAGRDDVNQLAILGFSEGGTASLLAAARIEPGMLCAVVGIGGYADIREDARDSEQELTLVGRTFREVVLGVMWLYGVPFDAGSPLLHIGEIDVPILLIYGSREADSGRLLLDAADGKASLVVIEGAGHGEYRTFDEAAYEAAILTFLQAARVP